MKKKRTSNNLTRCFILLSILALLSSCKVYKQNIIFQTEQSINTEAFSENIALIEGNYYLKAYDKISVEVFTNQGERIIDPNNELTGQMGNNVSGKPSKIFQVFADTTVILPLVGKVSVQNESVQTFQEKLQKLYSEIYIQPYVRVSVANQRVIMLGALGGQIIPIENDNTSLLEVLAAAGGLNNTSKGTNIKLIRGPLNNPNVQIINLKTIEGMKAANLRVLPNDVIYVEPIRRVFNESIRDIAPIIGIVTNIVTLFIVIQNYN